MSVRKRYIIYLLFTFCIIISDTRILAQEGINSSRQFPEPVFEHFTYADKLPASIVIDILQDHLGYLWFSTRRGLVRYDGYEMKLYQHDPSDSLSINGSFLIALCEDQSGDIWVGTLTDGLNRFNRLTETFTRYLHNPKNPESLNAKRVGGILNTEAGNMLIGTSRGLEIFKPETNGFRHINYKDSVYSDSVYEYLSSLKAEGKIISSIPDAGLNNVNLTKTFEIKHRTTVLFVLMGEQSYSGVRLERVNGQLIIESNSDKSLSAGGNKLDRIQIVIDTLKEGTYRLHYWSNPDSWNGSDYVPPDHPDFKGVRVIELPGNASQINRILNQKKFTNQNYSVDGIIQDRLTKKIFVAFNNKIMVYDSVKGLIAQKCNTVGDKGRLGRVYTFCQAADGTIWIAHSLGLAKFNSIQNTIRYYKPSGQQRNKNMDMVIKIAEDSNGFIWFFSGAFQHEWGLMCFDPRKEKFKSYLPDPQKRFSSGKIFEQNIMSIFVDRTGILWVGYRGGGVDKWDSKKHKLKYYPLDIFDVKDEYFTRINAITEDRFGTVWLVSSYTIYSFNRYSNEFHYYHYGQKTGINNTNAIYADSSGIVWFGTTISGLGRLNPLDGTFKFYKNDPFDSTTISNNGVTSILPDKNDFLWLGTYGGGLNRFNKKTGKFTHYIYNPEKRSSRRHNFINKIFEKDSGEIWVATTEGLDYFDPETGIFKPLILESGTGSVSKQNTPYDGTINPSEISRDIISLSEDKKGNLWIGTYDHGLNLYDKKKNAIVYSLTTGDGLNTNGINDLLADDTGNLWIAHYGLAKFNTKTRTLKYYFTSSGVESNIYQIGACYKTSSGELLFGTRSTGFVVVNPDSVKDDPYPPQVVITRVSLFNKPGEKLDFDGFIPEMKELDLSYDESDLRFDYIGLHYADPQKNRYKYKLEGFDRDWVDAGTQRNAIYTNLDAGEYTFRVTACNYDGVWNVKGASIKIVIPPPFWATWWAYGFYLIVFGSVLYGVRKYEMSRLNWKNQSKLDEVKLKEREETDRMKSRFFANISHEFRTPLTLILGPSENILEEAPSENTTKQAGAIKRNTKRLLNLINQLLDLSKLEAGKLELNASKGNIVSFIKGITMSFESAAERKDIMLKVKADRDEIELYFDREKMTKIMTNLLSNAFKFTVDGGEITVTVNEKDNSFIEIKVKDTGIGISEEELPKLFDRFYQVDSSQTREYEGTGLGLALTKELVELHRGTIMVNSKPGEGSEFIISLPPGRKHLTDKEIVETEEIEKPEMVIDEREYVSTEAEAIERTDVPDEDKNIVLIVEDNRDVREFIKDSIGDEFETEEASNGEQGLRKAEKFIPDLIISDIMMPKMDGNELTRRIRNDEKTSHIPVILLTAKSEQENRLEGLETGADDYLIKPFDSKELRIRIKNLIEIRRKLQEKYSSGEYIRKKDEKKLSGLDEKYMNKVTEVIEKHLSEEDFSVELFDKEVGMSRIQNYRKLKALTGSSPSRYIRKVRLMKARDKIRENEGNISEIAYSVGFSSPAYFTKCFKEEFGYPPSGMQK